MHVAIAWPLSELLQGFQQEGRAPAGTLQVLRSKWDNPTFEIQGHPAGAGFAEWCVQVGEVVVAVLEDHRPQAFQNLKAVIARGERLECQLLRSR
ncbi:hypothetical protein D9M68_887210 [compost metagenome]